jgi:peptidoglycan/xylan/chitin deacetylase (PgdA/CDA1 family)
MAPCADVQRVVKSKAQVRALPSGAGPLRLPTLAVAAVVLATTGLNAAAQTPAAPAGAPAGACARPVYLTFDTGHMGVAPLVAEVLKRHQVRVTFFAANERTQEGDGSLGNTWAPWWKARAAEGHEFATHTWDHAYWRGDLQGIEPRFRIQPSAGALAGREFTWDAAKYCENLSHAAQRLEEITGRKPLPLFRAPGGKTSPRLLAAARACGYEHVGWAPAGFLGDELPSEKFSNDALLKKALRDVRAGDILLAHLGIWSRKDAWAPAVLEPLIVGLKDKGFCFETLRQHPAYRDWIASRR